MKNKNLYQLTLIITLISLSTIVTMVLKSDKRGDKENVQTNISTYNSRKVKTEGPPDNPGFLKNTSYTTNDVVSNRNDPAQPKVIDLSTLGENETLFFRQLGTLLSSHGIDAALNEIKSGQLSMSGLSHDGLLKLNSVLARNLSVEQLLDALDNNIITLSDSQLVSKVISGNTREDEKLVLEKIKVLNGIANIYESTGYITDLSYLDKLQERGIDTDQLNENQLFMLASAVGNAHPGNKTLGKAVSHGMPEVTRYLIQQGVTLSDPDNAWRRLVRSNRGDQAETAKALIESGYQPSDEIVKEYFKNSESDSTYSLRETLAPYYRETDKLE